MPEDCLADAALLRLGESVGKRRQRHLGPPTGDDDATANLVVEIRIIHEAGEYIALRKDSTNGPIDRSEQSAAGSTHRSDRIEDHHSVRCQLPPAQRIELFRDQMKRN